MNLEQLRASGHIMLESIVGSNLYGLNTPESDIDTKGIFKLPNEIITGFHYPQQINDEKSDTVFYEIGRYLELAMKANPNTLELLWAPEDKLITTSPLYDVLKENRNLFLTKQIRNSLGGYAIAQIKKARGQNKKIVNPIDKKRKDILDFCYILTPIGTIEFREWLVRQRGSARRQENYGAVNLNHAHNMFYIYYNEDKHDYRGLTVEGSNEIRMSSIPKSQSINYSTMYCNSEGYSTYCKEYKEYWEWVGKRNPVRYAENADHGKGYDGKNLMHCFRLLDMGIDACKTGELIVKRPDREWLLSIRKGEQDYDDLIKLAESKIIEFDKVVEACSLPINVDEKKIIKLLKQIRWD